MPTGTLSKTEVRSAVPKDTYPLIVKAIDQGFTAHRGGKHIKLKNPEGKTAVTVSKTPTDFRDIKNLQSDLIKAGVDLTPTKERAAKKKAAKRARPMVAATRTAPSDKSTDKPIHTGAKKDEEIFPASEVIELIIEGYKANEEFKAVDVHEALIDSDFKVTTTSMANVRTKMGAMLEEGKIQRVGRGVYSRIATEEKKAIEPTNDDVLEALKEIPLKVPVEASADMTSKMDRINDLFKSIRDEMREVDTLDSKVWYEFFVMMSARERLQAALEAAEADANGF